MFHKSWVFSLVVEIIYYVIRGSLFFVFFYPVTDGVIFPLILAVSPMLLMRWYDATIQHKPPRSKLYRLPLVSCKGTIAYKHIHKCPKNLLMREYVIIDVEDGLRLKLYVPAVSIGDERAHLYTFNIGDTGTIHYRKGKKHCYFEEFEKFEPDEEEMPELYD